MTAKMQQALDYITIKGLVEVTNCKYVGARISPAMLARLKKTGAVEWWKEWAKDGRSYTTYVQMKADN